MRSRNTSFATARTGFDGSVDRYYAVYGHINAYTGGLPWASLVRPLATRDLVRRIDVYEALITASREPWPGRLDRISAIQMPAISKYSSYGVYVEAPADTIRALAIDAAEIGSARLAVAIERFRRANGDRLPARLDEVTPAFLDKIPFDPFSGKPMLYRVEDGGYVVYSVGPDRKDDGGVTSRAKNAGFMDLRQTSGSRCIGANHGDGVRKVTGDTFGAGISAPTSAPTPAPEKK